MVLNPDFREFVALLNAHNVRYLVVGGHAVAAHGHPRYTDDLDLWVDATTTNAQLIIRVLNEFGFGSVGLTEDDFIERDNVIQLGYPPNRIDMLTDLSGVDFEECYLRRFSFEYEGLALPFIGLDCLKKNKRATGRNQDLGDLDNLS